MDSTHIQVIGIVVGIVTGGISAVCAIFNVLGITFRLPDLGALRLGLSGALSSIAAAVSPSAEARLSRPTQMRVSSNPTNACTLNGRMGEAHVAAERYVIVRAQLRLSRSIAVGERYVSQHPFTSEMSEVRVKSLGDDGPSTTGTATVWVPRLGDLAELHARDSRRSDPGRPASWYRAKVLRDIAAACERYPDATAEEAAARLLVERRR